MARRVVGLDLGAYSVKFVRLECGKSTPKFEVLNSVEVILPCIEGDERDLLEKQKEAISKLHQEGLFEAETFACGLEALESHMRAMKAPFVDSRKIEAILPGLLEAEVPFSIDDVTFSWHRVEESAQALTGAEKPDSASIRIAFGKKAAISRILTMLQGFAIDPRFLHLSSAAPYELVRELGFDRFFPPPKEGENEALEGVTRAAAIIDFGHRSTNICIFDKDGLKLSRSLLRGGQKLSEEIAKALEVPFCEAERLKHEKIDLSSSSPFDEPSKIINKISLDHHSELIDEIARICIALKTSSNVAVDSVLLIGGGALALGFAEYFANAFNKMGISIIEPSTVLPEKMSPVMALSFAYSLSSLQIHAKDNRFNFRKDEFAWRGELDFLRSKSTALILWGLVLICSLTVLWFTSSLVIEKENNYLENRLKMACAQILGQKNIAPKKCLAQMKEQISSNVDIGIPDFTASDVYLKTAEFLPKELNITISELDVTEKKVRISAETSGFEDVEKAAASLGKIPCFVNVEKGRAQHVGNLVKFTLSSDLDCNAPAAKAEAPPARL